MRAIAITCTRKQTLINRINVILGISKPVHYYRCRCTCGYKFLTYSQADFDKRAKAHFFPHSSNNQF